MKIRYFSGVFGGLSRIFQVLPGIFRGDEGKKKVASNNTYIEKWHFLYHFFGITQSILRYRALFFEIPDFSETGSLPSNPMEETGEMCLLSDLKGQQLCPSHVPTLMEV